MRSAYAASRSVGSVADVYADEIIAALSQFQFERSVGLLRLDELFAVEIDIPNVTASTFSALEDSSIRSADE